jgi:uncharacterized protein YhfF
MHPSVPLLWQRYISLHGDTQPALPPVEHFCDNQAEADQCAQLVAQGIKRATSSALAAYHLAQEPLPQPGHLVIVTDWSGVAAAIISTHTVTLRRFADVPAHFAWLEGEGDRSLTAWRAAHRAFWQRRLAGTGHAVDDDFQVVCEEFDAILIA